MTPLATSLCAALQAIAISGGTIHPMDGARPYQGCVVITEGVISACGADVQVPEGAQVIDAEGLHVVPGLIDGMMHHDGDHDDLYVRAGVLLGRDMGNDLGRIFFSRARRARAGARGPRLFVSGAVLDGVPPITTKAVIVRSPEEAKQKLERLLGLDDDFVATHMGVREALGGDHAEVGRTLHNICFIRAEQGRLDDALALAERAKRIIEAALGPAHPDAARPRELIDYIHREIAEYKVLV